MHNPSRTSNDRAGFTLVELLVVITIIVIVSAATLPIVVPAFNHRKVSEAARIVQATLAGTRDAAIRANAPRGIRLLPDPAFPGPHRLAANRMVAIEPAPDYSEGRVTIFAHNLPTVANRGRISVTESVFTADPNLDPTAYPENPTNWYMNIRQGDRIRLEDSGRYYTIAGPVRVGPAGSSNGFYNRERFVNLGFVAFGGQTVPAVGATATTLSIPQTGNADYLPTGSPNPFDKTFTGGEVLYLVNGQDDDGDGWVDESFDGIDNDGDGVVDPGYNGLDDNNNGFVDEPEELIFSLSPSGLDEYEAEQFIGSQFGTQFISRPYTISRRPVVSEKATEVALPEGIVIDLTTWNAATARAFSNPNQVAHPSRPERSRLPVDPYTLTVDIMLMPSGQVLLPTGGSGSLAGGMGAQASVPFYHFWVSEREDVFYPLFTSQSNPNSPLIAHPNYANTQNTRSYLLPMPNDGLSGYDIGAENALLPANAQLSNESYLKGDRRIVTLFTRTGQITTNVVESFNVANTELPFIGPQIGTREVK